MSGCSYAVGSLVRARERDWVVMPSAVPNVVRLRPLTGSEFESCSIYLPFEPDALTPATFPLPTPAEAGDFTAGAMVRDAARLSLRSSAAPFRSLGRLTVRPRPYQYVPLIMALRQAPVRLLIADDVGVGKTIEGALVAKELLERGTIKRMCVLCPPYLCEQWQRELAEKFHLDARVLRSGTVARLERELPRRDLSIYDHFSCLVASIDYIKREPHRSEFLVKCPELVIVDEVHACARPRGERTGNEQQQRFELVSRIAQDAGRHLVLLTATPHSGIEESFRSLLGLLDPRFGEWDIQTLTEAERIHLSRHFVQRRRADVEKWLGTPTPFPKRTSLEITYQLSPGYAALFNDVWDFARQRVLEPGMKSHRQRVRYWAAISLLRCVMSSPEAAVQALSRRERNLVTEGDGDNDEAQRWREVMDPLGESGVLDVIPEAVLVDADCDLHDRDRRKLSVLRRRAEDLLQSEDDLKLAAAVREVRALLESGHRPIVYCRFIPTARYVAAGLAQRLQAKYPDLQVVAVTGEMDDDQREARVKELAGSPHRVLVATDCLSEGINLQQHFDAVLHYDLPWNPNRLEQREGRVDRYGQLVPEVKALLLYGTDNPMDGAVLDVLLRKARTIRELLGINVPIPVHSETVMEAVVNALLTQGHLGSRQLRFDALYDTSFHMEWERAARREQESRTRFAQHAIKPAEVMRDLEMVDQVLGNPEAVAGFVRSATQRLNLPFTARNSYYELDASALAIGPLSGQSWNRRWRVGFASPLAEGVELLGRNHPLVEALSSQVLGEAFRPGSDRRFARCGAAYTKAVSLRTVLVVLRLRYQLTCVEAGDQFAEEVMTVAFESKAGQLHWLPPNGVEIERLLGTAQPTASIALEERSRQVEWALERLTSIGAVSTLQGLVATRVKELEDAHARLRGYVGGNHLTIRPYDPDVLGIYVLMPGVS